MNLYNAVLIDPSDNVITSLRFIGKGEDVKALGNKKNIIANSNVEKGHKIAITDIRINESVIKYGKKIGVATTDIKCGDSAHINNIKSERGKGLKRRDDDD